MCCRGDAHVNAPPHEKQEKTDIYRRMTAGPHEVRLR
jgi:hypothetical protein